MKRLWLLPLWVAVLATTALAADGYRARRMGVVRTRTHLTVSFRFPDLFSRSVRRKVDSGLQTTVLATVYAHRSNNREAVAGGTARTCLLTRDIWEEEYRATIVNRDGGERRHRVATFDEVVRLCADVRMLPVAPLSAFRSDRSYRISTRLEVNPLSRESVRRIQRWLRHPEPAGAGESGTAIFGSVASLFVNPRVGAAERTLLLRSQTFTVP